MRTTAIILLLLLAAPVAAQEQEIRSANLPRALERDLIHMYDGGARRVTGELTVAPGEVVREDLAVMGGPLVVAGRIDGRVAMVDGDVVLETGGVITGSVTVVGGEVRLADGATVGGTITAYGGVGRRYRDRPRDPDDDRWRDGRDRRDRRYADRGHAELDVRVGASYNRVEGLPLMFGPDLETAGPNPLRLEALAVWRSESVGESSDRMGYQAQLEQMLGGERRWGAGGTLYSVVSPMDRWQVSDLETSLATVLFHDDYRDHFERTGWSVFARGRPLRGVDARVEYRQEDYGSLAAGDPWSLFDRDDGWRPQPLVAEGELRLLGATLEVDRRDRDHDPREGWYGRLSVQRPVDGDLARPGLAAFQPVEGDDPLPGTLAPTPFDSDFTTALLDLRRHAPVGWGSQLNLRLVAGGSLAERPLPPQFQHTLGGPGTLPGYERFQGDCGARRRIGSNDDGAAFHPAYGCDRFVLGQVEYRGSLSLDLGIGDRDDDRGDRWDWWDVDVELDPTWVVFFDVARGWGYGDDPALEGPRTTGTLYDAGLGFLIEEVGIYMALPLSEGVEREPRFFIRLERRI